MLRSRERVFGVIGWLASGEAVTIVPAVRICGGDGLSGLKRGCIKSVIDAEGRADRKGIGKEEADIVVWCFGLAVGREKLGGLEDFGVRGLLFGADRVFSGVVWILSWYLGEVGSSTSPRGSPEEFGLDPGIVSNPDRVITGGEQGMTLGISGIMFDVS